MTRAWDKCQVIDHATGIASQSRINHPKPAQYFSLRDIYPHVSINRRVTPLGSTNGLSLVLYLKQGGGPREAIWGKGTG